MKTALILCYLCVGILLGGCAVSETSTDDVGRQFQQGLQGGGQIVPNDPTSDSYGPEYN
ncbi:MAG: hypothetical protein ACOVMP_08955 [Chthoniobacterales bacterium]